MHDENCSLPLLLFILSVDYKYWALSLFQSIKTSSPLLENNAQDSTLNSKVILPINSDFPSLKANRASLAQGYYTFSNDSLKCHQGIYTSAPEAELLIFILVSLPLVTCLTVHFSTGNDSLDTIIFGLLSLPSPCTAPSLPSPVSSCPLPHTAWTFEPVTSGKWKSTPQGAGWGPQKDSRDGRICLHQRNASFKHKEEELAGAPPVSQIRVVSSSTEQPPNPSPMEERLPLLPSAFFPLPASHNGWKQNLFLLPD